MRHCIKIFVFIVLIGSVVNAQTVTQQWAYPFQVANNGQRVFDMAIDDSSNVYICGNTQGNGLPGAFILKVSPGGTPRWFQTYDTNQAASYYTVDVDDSGNVYCAGTAHEQSTNQTCLMAKYDLTGQLIWSDTLGQGNVAGVDNVSDQNGSIITLIANYNVTLQKVSGNSIVWQKQNDTASSSYGLNPKFIQIDSAQNIYVGGDKTTSGDFRYFIKKFNSSGNLIWHKEFNPSGQNDVLLDMSVDRDGNVYLTGTINSSTNGLAIAKLDSSGNLRWSKAYTTNVSGPGGSAISADTNGNVYVSFRAYSTISSVNECQVLKYDSAGNFKWLSRMDTAQTSTGTDLSLDKVGDVYTTYVKKNPSSPPDYSTCKLLSSNGNVVWEIRYNGSTNNDDRPTKLLVDTSFSVFVTGTEVNSTIPFATTIKYSQNVGINELSPGSGISYFPNPFSENLTITSKNGFHSANLTLYNSLGEKVMEKSNSSGSQLNLSRNNLPAGIYFIRITDGEKCFSGKVIIQ